MINLSKEDKDTDAADSQCNTEGLVSFLAMNNARSSRQLIRHCKNTWNDVWNFLKIRMGKS